MTANYSSAARTREYQLTILETKPLLARLAVQIAFARNECKRDPRGFAIQLTQDLVSNKAVLLAVFVIAVLLLLVLDNLPIPRAIYPAVVRDAPEVVLMNIRTGPGGVGFNNGDGQGSAPVQDRRGEVVAAVIKIANQNKTENCRRRRWCLPRYR